MVLKKFLKLSKEKIIISIIFTGLVTLVQVAGYCESISMLEELPTYSPWYCDSSINPILYPFLIYHNLSETIDLDVLSILSLPALFVFLYFLFNQSLLSFLIAVLSLFAWWYFIISSLIWIFNKIKGKFNIRTH